MRAARREKDGRREGESARVCERVRACPFECVRCFQLENGVCARANGENKKEIYRMDMSGSNVCPGLLACFPLIFETSASLPSIETRALLAQTGAGGGRGGDESNDKIAFFANESCVKGRYGDNGFRGLISLSV